jgi:hypothetical protein
MPYAGCPYWDGGSARNATYVVEQGHIPQGIDMPLHFRALPALPLQEPLGSVPLVMSWEFPIALIDE